MVDVGRLFNYCNRCSSTDLSYEELHDISVKEACTAAADAQYALPLSEAPDGEKLTGSI